MGVLGVQGFRGQGVQAFRGSGFWVWGLHFAVEAFGVKA